MLRILKRYVNTTTKGLYFCRNRHSSAAVLSVKCLDWQPAEFNGVDVNLDQLGENYNLDEFSVRLKESILHWRKGRRTSALMKVPIAQSYLIPVAFDHGFSYHHAVGEYAMLLKWLPQWEQSKVPPYATHQVGVSGFSPNNYSGHSFSRGGATYASSLGISHELIQLQGDWASTAYLEYLARPLRQRYTLAEQVATQIASSTSTSDSPLLQ